MVAGTAGFQGTSPAGSLTAGLLGVGGNFSANVGGFEATGSHTLELNGASGQLITYGPANGTGINNLTLRNAGQKKVNRAVNILGTVLMAASMGSTPFGDSGGNYVVTLGTAGTGSAIIDSSTAPGGGWQVGKTTILGGATALPASVRTNLFTFAGGVTTLSKDFNATTVTVDGAGTKLKLNGHKVLLNGNTFTTQNGGVLEMTNAADSLDTQGGSAIFNGGSESGLLTAGVLGTATLQQGGSSVTSYAASGNHLTAIGSGAGCSYSFANPSAVQSHFQHFILTSGTSCNVGSDAFALGQFRTGAGVQFVLSGSGKVFTSAGANVNHLRLGGVRWVVQAGDSIQTMNDVQFSGQDVNAAQFTLQRAGGSFTFSNWTFLTAPNAGIGAYLDLQDTAAGTDTLKVNMTGSSPATSGGSVNLSGVQTPILTGFGSYIKLAATQAAAQVFNGDLVTVAVVADMRPAGTQNLAAISFNMAWDPTKFDYVSYNTTGASFGTSPLYTVNATNSSTGTITVGILDTDGFAGGAPTIINVVLHAKATGNTLVTVSPTAAGADIGGNLLSMIVARNLALTIN